MIENVMNSLGTDETSKKKRQIRFFSLQHFLLKGEVDPQNHSIDVFSIFFIKSQISLPWNQRKLTQGQKNTYYYHSDKQFQLFQYTSGGTDDKSHFLGPCFFVHALHVKVLRLHRKSQQMSVIDGKHQWQISRKFNQKSPLLNDLFFYMIRQTTIFSHFLGREKPWPVQALDGRYTQTMDSSLSLYTVDQYQGSRVACLKQKGNIF